MIVSSCYARYIGNRILYVRIVYAHCMYGEPKVTGMHNASVERGSKSAPTTHPIRSNNIPMHTVLCKYKIIDRHKEYDHTLLRAYNCIPQQVVINISGIG